MQSLTPPKVAIGFVPTSTPGSVVANSPASCEPARRPWLPACAEIGVRKEHSTTYTDFHI